jgi:hypothetical protein
MLSIPQRFYTEFYTAPKSAIFHYSILSFTAPFWVAPHPQSYVAHMPYWPEFHLSEFPCNLRARLYPTELRCTLY